MRKRGAHFRRRIDPAAGLQAIAMQHPLDTTQKTDLGVALRVSLEALRTGRATEQEFHTLAAAINVSLVLCERGTGNEYEATIKGAQEGLLRLWQRGQHTGRWVMDGPGLHHAMQCIDLHEAQIAIVSRQEAADAMREVKRRIQRGDVFEEQRA